MFSHDVDAANAVCKYWLWGYCSRKEKCFYLHQLPAIDTQQIQERAQREQREEAQRQQMMMKQKQLQQQRQLKQQRKGPQKPPSDLIMKMRLHSLKESFPTIPVAQITAAFTAKKYQLDETEKFLMQKYGKKTAQKVNNLENGKITGNSSMSTLSKKERIAERKRLEGATLMKSIGWVPTGESLNDLYRSSREQAEAHARRRNQLFMQSVDAYLRGNRKLAKELSKEGKEHDVEMNRLHRIASEHIFKMRNGKLRENVIDVHGLHVDEAIRKLKERIAQIRKRGGQKGKNSKKNKGNGYALDILTGTGHHSFGGFAKVGPAIRSFAQSQGIRHKKLTFVDGRGGNIRLFIV